MSKRILLVGLILALVPLAGCLEFGGDDDAAENRAPSAALESSKDEAWTGESIEFDASKSEDPDGEIRRYHFDFGDETTMEVDPSQADDDDEGKVDHAYVQGGLYKVTVTVFDDGGNRAGALTDSADVEVAINQNYSVPPQAVFAPPDETPDALANQSSEYDQEFEVFEAADRIEVNLTFEGFEGVGGSRIKVELLSPGENVVRQEEINVGSGETEEFEMNYMPVTEQGTHTMRVTAEDGGAKYRGSIDVYYGEGPGEEEEGV